MTTFIGLLAAVSFALELIAVVAGDSSLESWHIWVFCLLTGILWALLDIEKAIKGR